MVYQIDCFETNFNFLKYVGIWASKDNQFANYKTFTKINVFIFILFYDLLITINLYFMDKVLDNVVEELIVYFTLIGNISMVFTFILLPDNIEKILSVLEADMFQTNNETDLKVIAKGKKTYKFFWKIIFITAVTCHINHVLVPFINHIFLGSELRFPMSSYDFIPLDLKQRWKYPIYIYQAMGIHMNMWYNINIDAFFLGLLILTIVQLDILDNKLRRLTDLNQSEEERKDVDKAEAKLYMELKKCLIHYTEIAKFCSLIEATFSVTLFVKMNITSWIICVCLYRLALPVTPVYCIFLVSYMMVIVMQILITCWFGHQIYDKSDQLMRAAYASDWVSRSPRFKTNLLLLTQRTSRPISIVGLKIFPLSLTTFTSITNSAYSFYTLLRSVQNEK